MRGVVRLALLALLSFLLAACVTLSNYSFNEGISCFRAGNYRKAFIRLLPAAQKGQPDAQYAVGYMYYYGQGVVEDRAKAWYWIKSAASKGQPEAVAAAKILCTTNTIESV
ncbi:Sel-1 protein [Legionella beliardensis]|uniref:Sel-1 protein n=1 Tax=Legionella beliardensis TaxID=91822 RepID=A0A378I0N9_9GAMM|nr:SEL1-like repeat protein [Legionella beliardensis]STX28719.1 Sel-1 protein [Legionella beliardensis]